jgi:glycosyltransferase involved in cell wall biosynthesis
VGLYIDFQKLKFSGGVKTFLHNLEEYLEHRNYSYCKTYKDGDSFFFPIEYSLRKVIYILRKNGIIIQRLDGVHYYRRNGLKYLWYNKRIYPIYKFFADHVIFQSEYSRKQCFYMMGAKAPEQYDIILNGVNTQIFFPAERDKNTDVIRFVSTGSFRHADMIVPVVQALDSLVGKFNFEFHVVGPIRKESLRPWFQRDYLVHHGEKNMEEVATILRDCDAFIFSALNSACPNAVLEAVATGLPVVGFDSGATAELCYFAKDLLAYVSDDVLQSAKDFKPERLAEKIKFLHKHFDEYKKEALLHIDEYNLDRMGQSYVDVFEKVLESR